MVGLIHMSPRWGFWKGRISFFYRYVAPLGLKREGEPLDWYYDR